jgi:hypothetical protein
LICILRWLGEKHSIHAADFITSNRWYDIPLLLGVSAIMFRPDFFGGLSLPCRNHERVDQQHPQPKTEVNL